MVQCLYSVKKGTTLEDNPITTETPEPRTFYYFSYSFSNEGILESRLGDQETRDKLNRELASLYGPDGVTVTELRTATEAEISEYRKALEERYGLTEIIPTDVPVLN